MLRAPQNVIQQMGKYARQYDEISENDDDNAKQRVAEVLRWLEEPVPVQAPLNGSSNQLKTLLADGVLLAQMNKVAGVSALQATPYNGSLIDRATSVLKDLYYAAGDVLAGKKVKTSLLVTVCVIGGIAVGVVLGTLVFPGIGTAIGGTFGAMLAGSLGLAGGTLGLGILGGIGGSRLGKWLGAKVFKNEKRFELSNRVTNKLTQRIGIDSTTAEMINAYLYNREKTIKSPLCKAFYRTLRKQGIDAADPVGMEKIAQFFRQELILLAAELPSAANKSAFDAEMLAVKTILTQLQQAPGLASASREKISQVLSQPVLASDPAAAKPDEQARRKAVRFTAQSLPITLDEESIAPEIAHKPKGSEKLKK